MARVPPEVLEQEARHAAGIDVKLSRQVEHYFGDRNWKKDSWLRGKADDDGWVPLSVIAGFKLVKQKLTGDEAAAWAVPGTPSPLL